MPKSETSVQKPKSSKTVVKETVQPEVVATEVKPKTKVTKQKKTETPQTDNVKQVDTVVTPEVVPVATPVVGTEPVSVEDETDVVVTGDIQLHVDESFKTIVTELQNRIVSDRNLLMAVRNMMKLVSKERKDLSKGKRKRKNNSDNKKSPSGIVKPTLLSGALCEFLGVANGTLMARTEVTKEIDKYIKSKNLQNPESRKEIQPDEKLAALLNWDKTTKITYFNLQKYIKHHYPKAEVPLAVPVVV